MDIWSVISLNIFSNLRHISLKRWVNTNSRQELLAPAVKVHIRSYLCQMHRLCRVCLGMLQKMFSYLLCFTNFKSLGDDELQRGEGRVAVVGLLFI